ncbi:hypothetical protein E2C01_047494 [Portunus trituberculatus]|uniref:Uncharacterized protein n=1 Tax=Portunus trituberculatus TaxID=210409 RepID=A0A5B7GAM7_PORTR|nr:hypothetical protein [Portunus trituberculatus]
MVRGGIGVPLSVAVLPATRGSERGRERAMGVWKRGKGRDGGSCRGRKEWPCARGFPWRHKPLGSPRSSLAALPARHNRPYTPGSQGDDQINLGGWVTPRGSRPGSVPRASREHKNAECRENGTSGGVEKWLGSSPFLHSPTRSPPSLAPPTPASCEKFS